MPRQPNELNERQNRFVVEYVAVDLNATQAAIRAGYSKKTAESQGLRLLGNARVAAAIEKAKRKLQVRTDVTADQIINELRRIAFGDQRGVMVWGPDGVTLRPSAELTDDQAAAVAEVGETRTKDGGSLKLKTHDKVKALELLGKHLGIFEERQRITVEADVMVYVPQNGRG